MKTNHMDAPCESCSMGISATMPIRQSMTRIEGLEHRLKTVSDRSDTARRLKTMPGIGPITAMMIETMASNIKGLRRGCEFAAWFGMRPRQRSSGGQQVMGRMSKVTQRDIRRPLIISAMAVVSAATR
ncbi:transposase [Rhodobacter sp. 24-YEA-8]|uniref:transposase n=1 Tax=Rhodobacter sp. 24-YEA-8 TaxID=1884310 RepID=UPI000B84714D|nr:transposase [Rhodobacter sp. 24-YEA-8]